MKHVGWVLATLMLACAVSASAECAWVLWQENVLNVLQTNTYSQWWELHGAYTTHEQCLTVQQRIWDISVKNLEERQRDGSNIKAIRKVAHNYVSASLKSGGYSAEKFICLPDTIDPREKK
jgi:hypothetical protein